MFHRIAPVAATLLLSATLMVPATAQEQTTLTIATVSNPDMERLQRLSKHFTDAHPGIRLNWVTLDENALRQRVTTDIATKAGQFDIVSIGSYEVQIWAKRGWLSKLDALPPGYDVDDLLPSIRQDATLEGALYAAPFYGESAFTMYRKDIFAQAGLTMPEAPSWDFIRSAATKIASQNKDVHPLCLRGKPGWGENITIITAMANAWGASWFNRQWQPQFNQKPWADALNEYVSLMQTFGPPDAAKNGYLDTLGMFREGRCAIWVDATVAASAITDPQTSRVADKVGFALAPDKAQGKRSNWLWIWALGVSATSTHQQAAQQFVAWATSQQYAALVGEQDGWLHAPPGTRTSLYANPDYLKAAPFAPLVAQSIRESDPTKPSVQPVPYTGIQYVRIPEFPGIGTAVGSQFAKAVSSDLGIPEALDNAQWVTDQVIRRAQFIER